MRVEVVRKAIKNLHLGVYPPDGRVRVAAPLPCDDEAVRVAVIGKLRLDQAAAGVRSSDRPASRQREMVSGESHYFLGRRYRLRVAEEDAPTRISVPGEARTSC